MADFADRLTVAIIGPDSVGAQTLEHEFRAIAARHDAMVAFIRREHFTHQDQKDIGLVVAGAEPQGQG